MKLKTNFLLSAVLYIAFFSAFYHEIGYAIGPVRDSTVHIRPDMWSYVKMADKKLKRSKNDKEAFALYNKGLAIAKFFYKQEPENFQRIRDTYIINGKLAVAHYHLKEYGKALPKFINNTDLLISALILNASHRETQEYLASTFALIATIYNHQKKTVLAISSFKESIRVREVLLGIDPENDENQSTLAGLYLIVGGLYMENNQLTSTKGFLNKAFQTLQRLKEEKVLQKKDEETLEQTQKLLTLLTLMEAIN